MRTVPSTLGFIILFTGSILISGCKNDTSNPYGSAPTNPGTNVASPNTVLMSGMAFSPASITVSVGTTVTWKNNDGIAHTATSDTGVWDTGNVSAIGSTFTFTTAGTFPYHCTYHAAMGMTGTVIVR